jgi:hypothetical protein
MHTRRVVTFLLGIWMGCSLLLGFLTLENFRSPNLVLSSPPPPAAKMIEKLGQEESRQLLRHLAMEQSRSYLAIGEDAEIVIGVLLVLLLVMSSQTRVFPIAMAGAMMILVLVQHFGILPEIVYQGREADFPPGSGNFETQARVWTLGQMYVGAEAAKLLICGVLASYLFVFYAPNRNRKRSSAANPVEVDG